MPAVLLAERIHREGPIPFDAFVDAALYGEGGFFASGRGAGRAGARLRDQPRGRAAVRRVGRARALDGWWEELGRPDPFFVVEAGAGRGRLAADVLAAAPRAARALRYVLVERSAALRDAQRELLDARAGRGRARPDRAGSTTTPMRSPLPAAGPIVTSLGELPAVPLTGVVLANELLDNLPFRHRRTERRRLARGAGRRSATAGSTRRSCRPPRSWRPKPTSCWRATRRGAPASRCPPACGAGCATACGPSGTGSS